MSCKYLTRGCISRNAKFPKDTIIGSLDFKRTQHMYLYIYAINDHDKYQYIFFLMVNLDAIRDICRHCDNLCILLACEPSTSGSASEWSPSQPPPAALPWPPPACPPPSLWWQPQPLPGLWAGGRPKEHSARFCHGGSRGEYSLVIFIQILYIYHWINIIIIPQTLTMYDYMYCFNDCSLH